MYANLRMPLQQPVSAAPTSMPGRPIPTPPPPAMSRLKRWFGWQSAIAFSATAVALRCCAPEGYDFCRLKPPMCTPFATARGAPTHHPEPSKKHMERDYSSQALWTAFSCLAISLNTYSLQSLLPFSCSRQSSASRSLRFTPAPGALATVGGGPVVKRTLLWYAPMLRSWSLSPSKWATHPPWLSSITLRSSPRGPA